MLFTASILSLGYLVFVSFKKFIMQASILMRTFVISYAHRSRHDNTEIL